MKLLFSIIIPTYNRAELLLEAIESIHCQDKEDLEIIVVDDGSSDHTKELIAQANLKNLKYYYQENYGQSAARNFGVEKAVGDYVIFMDDDDWWKPSHLDYFREAIARDQNRITIFRTGFKRIYQDGRVVAAKNYDKLNDGHPLGWAAFNMCGLWSLCIPRDHLRENHSPIGFPHWQDTHLILRLFAQYPFRQLNVHTYCYRMHEKMGSLRVESEDHLLKRSQINVAAMEDLFSNYSELLNRFLPKNTLRYLKAEKYLEYATLEARYKERKNHWQLFKLSTTSLVSFGLWKHYLIFFRCLFLR